MEENDFYKLPYALYSIEFYKKPLCEHDFNAVYEKLKYYGKKSGSAWFLVRSTTSSKNAKPVMVRTGTVGRPKKVIKGSKEEPHLHCGIMGAHGRLTADNIKKSLDKKYRKKCCSIKSKGSDYHAANYINYCYRQGDFCRQGGSFNFKAWASSIK